MAALLTLLPIIATAPARAAHPAWAPDEYELRHFETYKHFDGMHQTVLSARYRLVTLTERLNIQRLSLWLGGNAGELRLGGDHSTVISIGPVLQWDVLPDDGGLYLEIGFAPTYVEDARFELDNLGGPLEFTSHLLAGWRLSNHRGPFIGLRVQHISNGRIYDVNPGADFVGVVVGWRLR